MRIRRPSLEKQSPKSAAFGQGDSLQQIQVRVRAARNRAARTLLDTQPHPSATLA